MQVNHALSSRTSTLLANPSKKHARRSTDSERSSSQYVIEEINAYIAIRDELLAEAENLKTPAKIDSLCVANEFVATCLKPARSPYQSQYLPETDAIRERTRCEAVNARIATLRSPLAGMA